MRKQPTATFTAKQERLALFLASGKGVKAAAAEVGVGERTAHTWLDDPAFDALVGALRRRLLDEAVGRLAGAAAGAVETLVSLSRDGTGSVQVKAALGILDMLIKVRESIDLEGRVAALEGGTLGSDNHTAS
jgi:hypothetical protein